VLAWIEDVNLLSLSNLARGYCNPPFFSPGIAISLKSPIKHHGRSTTELN